MRMIILQDGATSHTTKNVLDWLRRPDRFGTRVPREPTRVISRLADKRNRGGQNWPSRSPDLNPLDYWFWSHIQKKIKDRCMREGRQTETIEEIRVMVEEESADLSEDVIRRSVANIRKRAEKCVQENGGHFQQLMTHSGR